LLSLHETLTVLLKVWRPDGIRMTFEVLIGLVFYRHHKPKRTATTTQEQTLVTVSEWHLGCDHDQSVCSSGGIALRVNCRTLHS